MAGPLDHLELRDPCGQGRHDLLGGGDRRDGVELPHRDERRRVDTAELVDDVGPANELISEPSGTSDAPSTSNHNRVPFTSTCIYLACVAGRGEPTPRRRCPGS